MPSRPTLMLPGLIAGSLLATLAADAQLGRGKDIHPDLPDNFVQLIPRGRIASVDKPEFVSAEAAKIAGDAWILGVANGGEARAYSLNLLNRHEIVNDNVGGRALAAVW